MLSGLQGRASLTRSHLIMGMVVFLALCAHPGLPLQGVPASCLPSWRLALAPQAAQR